MNEKEKKFVVVKIENEELKLPILIGTEDEKAFDISPLRAETGYVTLDSAFMNTASCTSNITFLDGEKGILRYRGYPIEELAEKANFMEIAYLLIFGELPKATELKEFKQNVAKESTVDASILGLLKQMPKHSHPMGILSAAIVTLSGVYPQLSKPELTPDERMKAILLLMGQMKSISAQSYRLTHNLPLITSDPSLGYCEDFLTMFGKTPKKEVVGALNVLLILHADHEQNCSTSTVRLVGSSKANLFASISAGVNALWGPLHGGANQQVIEMLEAIKASGGDYKKFITKAKDKKGQSKLMGFGHRVYKNFDPRAKIIKKSCDSVLKVLKINDPLFEIAKGLEEAALSDPYFIERNLYPNVDFYSGIIYKALGIPSDMFTVMFALGRLPGWLAQWKEMLESNTKIGRPRQIYTGKPLRRM